MLGLTRTPAMATLFFNEPECERKRGKHRLLSPDVFLLLSYQQHLGSKPDLLNTRLGCSE